MIVPDDGYDGLVIRLKGPFWSEITQRNDDSLIVGAGARLKEICLQACKMEMKGFEFLEGIPGTLGGALRMNAGAMGWEIFDLVEWVSFLLPDGTIREIPGSEMNVGYRHCKEAVDGIALRAKLRGEGRSDHREIRKAIDKLSRKRRDSQPREASAGCIFRNPEEASAGWLIDQAGLKGESVGGARISEVHGNFIVNAGGATAEYVISLMKKVKRRVRDHQGVELNQRSVCLEKLERTPVMSNSDKTVIPRISVLSGGVGAERQVSLQSGQSLADALEELGPVDLIDLVDTKLPDELDPRSTIVFPIIHGTFGEDGALQALLEDAGFAFAGCDAASSRLCMHKGNSKDRVSEAGVRVVRDIRFREPREVSAAEVIEELGEDLVVNLRIREAVWLCIFVMGKRNLAILSDLSHGEWMIEQRVIGREVTIGMLAGSPLVLSK